MDAYKWWHTLWLWVSILLSSSTPVDGQDSPHLSPLVALPRDTFNTRFHQLYRTHSFSLKDGVNSLWLSPSTPLETLNFIITSKTLWEPTSYTPFSLYWLFPESKDVTLWNTWILDEGRIEGLQWTSERVTKIATRLYDVLKRPSYIEKYWEQIFYTVVTPFVNNGYYRWNGKIEIGKIMADRLNDDELAILIGHEIGHGINPKNKWVEREKLTLAEKRILEKAADEIWVELAIAAWFSPEAWKTTFPAIGWAWWVDSDHPTIEERTQTALKVIEIFLKK